MAIPNSMRAVQLRAYDGKPESMAVVEMPVPRPGAGEVLVRLRRSGQHDWVRFWHKADMLNALTNVRFWGQSGLTHRCLPISIYEYTA
jgi:hypothetical protein